MSQPTIEDVARSVGLSPSTVSRALRGLPSVRPSTIAKVRKAASELGYSTSRAASSLASGRSMRIVTLFPWRINTWFNANVFEGIRSIVSPVGYDAVPMVSTSPESLDQLIDSLPSGRDVDGLVVASFSLSAHQRDTISKLRFPVVGVNVPLTEGFSATVCIDDRSSEGNAVRALHSLGHRRMAFVEQPLPYMLPYSISARGRGFADACSQLGLAEGSCRIVHAAPDDGVHDFEPVARDAINSILSSDLQPTALLGETDEIAVQLVRVLRELGYDVPGDFSVMGFDDDDVAGVVGLSTVQQSPEQLGHRAGEILLELLGGETLTPSNLITPTKVVLRSTTCRLR